MPNTIDTNGLTVKTLSELVSDITAAMISIYGTDINIEQNSPDGQMINIFAQSSADVLELLASIYASFNPDTAYGTILDQRVALNGIQRRAGTFTFTNINITTDRALNLAGLDADIASIDGIGYTVADDSGNQFILAATTVIAGAGVNTLSFRAKDIGEVLTVPNTITNQVTVTLGITTVNNPAALTTAGVTEESDSDLKIRRQKSFSLQSTSNTEAMNAALLAAVGVTDALVVENDDIVEVDGIPPHSIWPIVEGGTDAVVANAIYSKKNIGCGMRGAESYVIVRESGATKTILFDRPTLEDLYIEFSILPKKPGIVFNEDLIKSELAAVLSYKLGQSANIGDVVTAMFEIEPLAILTSVGVSTDGISYGDIVYPADYDYKFSVDVARIDIV